VPKYSELIDGLEKLMLRKRTAVRRSLEGARTHLKASSRGLPKLQDLVALPRQRFDSIDRRLSRALLANTRAHATRLARISGRLSPAPILQKHSRCGERLQVLERRAGRALLNRVAVSRRVLDGKAALLKSLGYHSILSRGFALVRNEAGQTIRQAAAVVTGSMLNVEFSDGQIAARAEGPLKSDPAKADPGAGKTPRQKPRRGGGQGSLF